MKYKHSEKGFSLIELLMVVVIIGLLSAIAIPSVTKSKSAAEKGAIIGVMRTMHTDQLTYFTRNARFARLNELNTSFGDTFGTTVGSRIYRGNYIFIMNPTPTDTSLRNGYQVIAYRIEGRFAYPAFIMNQTGSVQTLLP